jgi:DNA-binding transcriptional LysR family regulator
MKTQTLKSFLVLAQTLHFARAAEQLGIGQATLSQQIASLESELGAQLLYRDSRSVRLTPAGQVFAEEAQVAVTLLDAAAVKAELVARGELGELRVGATSAALLDLLPLALESSNLRFPRLVTQVQEHSSMVQEQMLLARELDVGVLHPPLAATGLSHEGLGEEPMVLALWDGHPLAQSREIALEQLHGARLLLPFRESAPHLVASIRGALRATDCRVTEEEHHCAPGALLSLVAARRGVAFVPGAVRRMERPGVVTRPLLGQPLSLQLAVAWRSGDQRATVHNFVRLCAQVAQASIEGAREAGRQRAASAPSKPGST